MQQPFVYPAILCRCLPHLQIFTPQHLGPLAQVQLLTGWSPASVDLLFLGFIAHGLAGALWTEAPTYNPLNQQVSTWP